MFSRSQVDRAGDVLREDPANTRALAVLEWWRRQHIEPQRLARSTLNDMASESGGPGWKVSARLKKAPQIVRKLRASHTRLSTLDDIAGCRLVVDGLSEVQSVAALFTAQLEIRTAKDMITVPSPLGYRAIHLLCRVEGRRVEIQLRTLRQHRWAEMVEAHDRDSGDDAKHGNAPPSVIERFRVLSNVLATLDHQRP